MTQWLKTDVNWAYFLVNSQGKYQIQNLFISPEVSYSMWVSNSNLSHLLWRLYNHMLHNQMIPELTGLVLRPVEKMRQWYMWYI